MNDLIDFVVMVFFGVGLGLVLGLAIWGGIPEDFQCTGSDIVDGIAECVKYEKKVTQ